MRNKPLSLAVTATAALAVTAGLGALAPTAQSSPAAAPAFAPSVLAETPDGFASVNAEGQNGTTGGAGGSVVMVSDGDAFAEAAESDGALIIQVDGSISLDGMQDVASDKTIIGIGSSGAITGGGLDVDGSSNVIIRNLTFTGAGDDAINITDGAHHVWVDHCDLSGASDGALDIKRGSDFVTVTYNHFHDQQKNSLIGHSDGNGSQDLGNLRATYHHNFFEGTAERNPRVRFADPVHVYNNYYLDIGGTDSYGVATAMDAGVLVEANYFENVESPTKIQIFESDPGRLVERGNIYDGSGTPESAGTVTEPSTYYDYTLDDPADLPGLIPGAVGVGKLG
ncbi:pectate lyase family protein [Streptomyces litchfieldiae]|uniref:Right-handed parallel beta-helix repeat-containing protein n=1 Tax=Streptomyces litchfieldiae TaxID=3075543 RepID=A0ABU2MYY0_9ACTN|nr:right-handed parallel beta-helix repeat-containing protein [Streptomyces sp. DSM 44938]MDT0346483.1 right-handed parallel beta-helix repeat-containing protein [Streptomyces sp. DSM 44938]